MGKNNEFNEDINNIKIDLSKKEDGELSKEILSGSLFKNEDDMKDEPKGDGEDGLNEEVADDLSTEAMEGSGLPDDDPNFGEDVVGEDDSNFGKDDDSADHILGGAFVGSNKGGTTEVLSEDGSVKSRRAKKHEGKKSRKWLYIGGGIIGAVLIAGIGSYVYFGSHFLPGASANGIDIGFKTSSEAYKAVQKLNVKDSILVQTGTEGVKIDLPNKYTLKEDAFKKAVSNYNKKITIDVNENYEKELRNKLDAISFPEGVKAVNAKLVKTSNGFEIVKEKDGSEVNKEELINSIIEDAKNNDVKEEYDAKNFYKKADITADSKEIVASKTKLNNTVNKKIVLNINGKKHTISKKAILYFMGEDGKVIPENVYHWVQYTLDPQYSTVNKGVTFTNVHGQKMRYKNIAGLGYGWDINYPSARDEIVKALNNDAKEANLTLKIDGDPSKSMEIKDDYIEVDLEDQMVYVFKDGKEVIKSPTITGSTKGQTATPPGLYIVANKEENKTLRGYNEVIKDDYAVPVKRFITLMSPGGVITGIGLHDSYSKSSVYGQKTLFKTSWASGGCLNLPEDKALKIYDIVDMNMPTVIYGHIYDGTGATDGKPTEHPEILN